MNGRALNDRAIEVEPSSARVSKSASVHVEPRVNVAAGSGPRRWIAASRRTPAPHPVPAVEEPSSSRRLDLPELRLLQLPASHRLLQVLLRWTRPVRRCCRLRHVAEPIRRTSLRRPRLRRSSGWYAWWWPHARWRRRIRRPRRRHGRYGRLQRSWRHHPLPCWRLEVRQRKLRLPQLRQERLLLALRRVSQQRHHDRRRRWRKQLSRRWRWRIRWPAGSPEHADGFHGLEQLRRYAAGRQRVRPPPEAVPA